MGTSVRVQTGDFDLGEAYQSLTHNPRAGAVVCFVGLVRDLADEPLEAMELEHYPGMTEKALETIARDAAERWPLEDTLIIHRVGRLKAQEQIVLVGVSSGHRQAAFEACQFIMDFLKNRAPFWKKEITASGARWVAAKASDRQALERWHN